MGKYSLLVTRGRNTKMMKTIAIVLLAAVAFAEPEAQPKAEADPYLLYGGYGGYGYGHGLGYAGYHGLGYHGLGYSYGKRSAEADPYRYGYHHLGNPRLGFYGHGYHGLGYVHHYGKRSAEAEPAAAADPYLLYGRGYGYGHLGYAGHYGYPYGGYAYYG